MSDSAGNDRRLFRETQDASSFGQERFSGCGQAHDSIRPLEQRRTNLVLKQANLSTQGRLGHIQPLRRTTEMKLFRHCDEAT